MKLTWRELLVTTHDGENSSLHMPTGMVGTLS